MCIHIDVCIRAYMHVYIDIYVYVCVSLSLFPLCEHRTLLVECIVLEALHSLHGNVTDAADRSFPGEWPQGPFCIHKSAPSRFHSHSHVLLAAKGPVFFSWEC